MIDELEAKRQHRRDIREGLISWLKFLREHVPTEKRGAIAAEVVLGLGPDPVQRVLDACDDEDLVAFMARIAGAKAFGELVQHMRGVQFLETEAERVAREAKTPRAAYAKLGPVASAWLWGALSSVRDRARREGSEVVAVMDALLDAIRAGAKTS